MKTLFDNIEIKEYRGVTIEKAQKATKELGNRMFNMFDKNENTYRNGSRSLSLMWSLSFTIGLVAREAVDYMVEHKETLENAFLYVLADNRTGYVKKDLLALIKK